MNQTIFHELYRVSLCTTFNLGATMANGKYLVARVCQWWLVGSLVCPSLPAMQMLEMINVSCDVAATTDYQRATTHHRLIIIQPCILFRKTRVFCCWEGTTSVLSLLTCYLCISLSGLRAVRGGSCYKLSDNIGLSHEPPVLFISLIITRLHSALSFSHHQ